ncbi:vesicle coat component [Haplosporangium sp. Z 11]|nr:vesicle coat component [Haplosporangium sp. Z 11]
MSQQQPPVEDGPIPFFGGGPPPPAANRSGPPPPRQQQQQRPSFQHQHPGGLFQNQNQPVQPQPQRHPQQHPHQMPPQIGHHQPHQQNRAQPSRQMNQSPFAPAADLFSSAPPSNPLFNQSQVPQGYQPQGGFPAAQGPPQRQQQQSQVPPPRFPQQSSVLQKNQQQPPPVQPPAPIQQQQQAPPPQRSPFQQQQQQQQQPTPSPFQRNPQQQPYHQQFPPHPHQQQQQESGAALAPIPASEQSNSPFGSASDLFGNSASQGVSGWSIPATADVSASSTATAPVHNAPAYQQQQQQPPVANPISATPISSAGRPPLPPAPLQKQASLPQVPQIPQVQQSPLVPQPQRQPSLQPTHQPPPPTQYQPSRQGSLSIQGPPHGPPRHSPTVPGPHGPSQAQLPPLSRASISTPRHGPLSGPMSASASASPYANHIPPKTPLLTAIQTPLMLPAQTPQAYQSSRTPYMGPLRNQFGSSSQLVLEPCPYSECGGENKPQAKFCSECGRAISAASRSATPSLGHYAEYSASAPPPMPSLDRINSYTQEPQQQPLDHHQQPQETYPDYTQGGQDYQQQQQQQPNYSQDQQQYGYTQDQAVYEQGYDQNQAYNQTYDQGYADTGYYEQGQQYYDPATGQYIDSYAQQEQVVPEPEPEPEEEGIDDPLNRIHGGPLVAFGFGGKIMMSFPRSVQRFDSATSNMVTKRYPGDLQLELIKDIMPVDKFISTYPGPLLMDSSVQLKNKRKDVLKLIEDKINECQNDHQDSTFDAHRVLIWELLKVMIEQEGVLVGGVKVDESVRSVLLSIPLSIYPAQSTQEEVNTLRTSSSIDVLQDLLRNGDRTGAVRYAMSSNLWAHALVISSCVNKELWKEAVNGFVNQELTAGGGDLQANGREALRVLYALFSGQTQSAVNELIPLNLRAPVQGQQDDVTVPDNQFVSAESLALMTPVEAPKIPNASLDQWRDTLVMILSNRTSGDQTAISSLGDMLIKEGWVEAAHICYLLSPQSSVHSGPDAQLNRLVLIGADANPHAAIPFYKNTEAFQKTEIYEFASALRSAGATGGLPFLQAYKLIYVWTLVELGMFSEAGRYLESVEAIVKSQTKGSPYYNTVFLERLKDITERLTGSSQISVAGESWFAKKVPKPTIGGIFDALDNKISKFIAGDNDQPKPLVEEPKANSTESGPFANAPALPDLSNIPARTASRTSNGVRAMNVGVPPVDASRRSSVLGRSSMDAPKTDAFGHLHPPGAQAETASQATPAVDMTANQDQSYGAYEGYDQTQTGQFNAEAYPQGDYNVGYENQGNGYDSTQTYGETYQGQDASAYQGYDQQSQAQEQPQAGQDQQTYTAEETYQTQADFEGQYDAQYNAQYNAQYEAQYETYETTTGEAVATLAIQPDVVPTSIDSAEYSTQAVLGSEKPSMDGQNEVAPAADATATAAATAGGYDANYSQYAEGADYNYAQDGNFNGENQTAEYYQGQEYQSGEYQQGQEYQSGEYQQGQEYHAGEYQQGQEYQAGEYQQGQEYQQDYQQGDNVYNEQQYDQTSYQDPAHFQNAGGVDQGVGAEYNDDAPQDHVLEQKPLEDALQQQQALAVSNDADALIKHSQVLADEPTFEQQGEPQVATHVAEISTADATAPQQPQDALHQGESQQGEQQQTEYQQGEYAEGDYQQSSYQQGDYQQGEYQQGDYQQGEYAQDGYQQQGEYAQEGYQQQGEYQQADYQQGDYQQGEYQQGEYQQGDYQQADYQQGEYQQGDYQQGDYQQGDYQQSDYQQGEYQQGEYQQGEYQQADYVATEHQQGQDPLQPSTEPGVLPVSSEDHAEYNASGVYQGHPNGAEYAGQEEQQQQDYAATNNAWWGNGDGAYVDPNADQQQQQQQQHPLPTDGQTTDGNQEPVPDTYEEGQFISFGAVPTIPTFGQPALPVNNDSHQQNTFDDEDDLGMGNSALKKEKPAAVAEDANATASTAQEASSSTAAADGTDESQAKWWPISLFGGEKREPTPKPVRANLGEESSFYFDKEKKCWVNKKGGSETSSNAEPLRPPPTSRTATPGGAPAASGSPAAGPPAMARGPPSSGGTPPIAGGPPGPRPGAGTVPRRGARSRYVDVLNTN